MNRRSGFVDMTVTRYGMGAATHRAGKARGALNGPAGICLMRLQ